MPRSLDEIIGHYQQASQQLTMPTPVPPPAMAPATQAFRPPPYTVPNAYQQTLAMGAPRTIEHYTQSQARTPMGPPPITPVPPLPMTPTATAGMAPQPQFTDPYQARVAGALGSMPTSYQDIRNQRAQAAGGMVGSVGGAIAGGAIGGVQGAMTGEFFGGMAGGLLNKIPGVGHALRGYQSMRWGGAMEQTAAAGQLRQGTFGALSLGQEDMGLGGQGMSATAAHRLTQSLGTGQQGGFNRQDLVNLTGAAAETGFLSEAGNVEQIAAVVKNLAGLMGEMAKLTGDPDFRNNLRELAQMRNMGLGPEQAVQTLRDQRMYARMAGGMAPVQRGGQVGAALFQQAGLTPGLGMQLGQGAAGVAAASMGGLSSTQRGLFGGQEGVTSMMAATQAQFMGETSKMILPYIVEKGANGQLQINQQRLEEVRSGRVGMQTIASRGAANMGRMGFGSMQDLIAEAPDLQTQMGQQLGEIGTFTMIANQVKDIQAQNPSLTTDTAAAMLTGSRERGRLLANQMRNPEMLRKMQGQIEEQIRQEKFAGRQQRLRQLEQTPGVLGRIAESNLLALEAQPAGMDPWDFTGRQGRAEQRMEAFRDAAVQQRAEDEAMGIRRIQFGPGAQFSEKERRLATERAGRVSRIGRVDLRGRGEEEVDVIGTGRRLSTGRQRILEDELQAARGLQGGGVIARVIGGEDIGTTRDEIRQTILGDVEAAKVGGERIREVQTKYTEEQFEAGDAQLRGSLKKRLGAPKMINAMAKMKSDILSYAQQMGSEKRGLDRRQMQKKMVAALVQEGGMSQAEAEKWVRKNEKAMDLHAFHWVDQTKHPQSMRALLKTRDAGGIATQAMDQEALEDNIKATTEDLNETYAELGLAGAEGTPTEPEEAGIRALFEEEDPKVRALAMLMGGVGGAGVSDEVNEELLKLEGELMNDPAGKALMKKARKLASKVKDPAQRARMSQRFGEQIAEGDLSLDKMAQRIEKGIRGEAGAGQFAGLFGRTTLAGTQAELKRRGLEETETGEGAGGTTESATRVKRLEDQKAMLDEMAGKLNEASSELLEAARMIKGEEFQKDTPKQTVRIWGNEYTL